MDRLNWAGVAAVVAVAVVSVVMLAQHEMHETAMATLQPGADARVVALLESIRGLLRWLAFLASVAILRPLLLLCVRSRA